MSFATRRSRRVAGLSPSGALPVAIPVAATPVAKRTGFRKTANRSVSQTPVSNDPDVLIIAHTNIHQLASASKKRSADRLSQDYNEAPPGNEKDDNNTTPKKRPCLDAKFNPAETPEAQLFRELAALTPTRLHNLPGTAPRAHEVSVSVVASSSLAVVASSAVVSVSVAPVGNLLSRFFASFEGVPGIQEDLANIMEVSKAIALWKDENQDKPLPSVASFQRFLDEHNTTPASPPTKMVVPANFSSTFRLDYDAFSSSDEDEIMPSTEQAPIQTISKAPIIITNLEGTFRAPAPDDSDSDSDDSSDDGEVALSQKTSTTTPQADDTSRDQYDNTLDNTPCPKVGAKKFSRSRSSSLNNTTTASQSIFDRGNTTASTENATSLGDASIADTPAQAGGDTQTPESISLHITQFPPRTPLPRKVVRPIGRREQPLGKTIMTANLFDYVEGQGVNTTVPISQQTVDDFNARAQSTYTPGMESHKLHGLESEIAQWADIGVYDHKTNKWDGKPSFDEEFMEFTNNMKTKLGEAAVKGEDVEMGLEMVVDNVIDMEHEGKTKEDFALENIRASPLAAIVDAIPEEEFMAMDEEL